MTKRKLVLCERAYRFYLELISVIHMFCAHAKLLTISKMSNFKNSNAQYGALCSMELKHGQ